MTKREYRRSMIIQKLMGLGLLGASALYIYICSQSPNMEDISPTLFMIPTGLILLFGRRLMIE